MAGIPVKGTMERSRSPYINIGDDFPLPNNIAYSAEGDAKSVKKLKLVLNVNVRQKSEIAHNLLSNYCAILTKKALNKDLPAEAVREIGSGKRVIGILAMQRLNLSVMIGQQGKAIV